MKIKRVIKFIQRGDSYAEQKSVSSRVQTQRRQRISQR